MVAITKTAESKHKERQIPVESKYSKFNVMIWNKPYEGKD